MGAIAGALLLLSIAEVPAPAAGGAGHELATGAVEVVAGTAVGAAGMLAIVAPAFAASGDCSEGCAALLAVVPAVLAYPELVALGVELAGSAMGEQGSYGSALGGAWLGLLGGTIVLLPIAAADRHAPAALGLIPYLASPIVAALLYNRAASKPRGLRISLVPALTPTFRGAALSIRF